MRIEFVHKILIKDDRFEYYDAGFLFILLEIQFVGPVLKKVKKGIMNQFEIECKNYFSFPFVHLFVNTSR